VGIDASEAMDLLLSYCINISANIKRRMNKAYLHIMPKMRMELMKT